MFNTKGETIEEITIGDNKYELRTNGIFVYSKNFKKWSPYAKRDLDRHWIRIQTTCKTTESIGDSTQKKKKK
jgi:hypothetical protein